MYDNIATIFKALSDETRLKILLILSKRKICAKGIAKHLNISEASVSQHLKILKEADIITGEKVGYYVHYNLKESTLSQISSFVSQISKENPAPNYYSQFDIPMECNADCKSNNNLCCKRINK